MNVSTWRHGDHVGVPLLILRGMEIYFLLFWLKKCSLITLIFKEKYPQQSLTYVIYLTTTKRYLSLRKRQLRLVPKKRYRKGIEILVCLDPLNGRSSDKIRGRALRIFSPWHLICTGAHFIWDLSFCFFFHLEGQCRISLVRNRSNDEIGFKRLIELIKPLIENLVYQRSW